MFQFLHAITFIAALMLNCGATFAQTPPTATEEFNLRIRCKEMAEQKLIDMQTSQTVIEMNRVEVRGSWQSSKYDAKNNRCYIRIYIHRFIGKTSLDQEMHSIYDAQIDELLAFAQIENGKKVGMVFDKDHRTTTSDNFGWDDAITYIEKMIADRRN
jgi:hypothetical protein